MTELSSGQANQIRASLQGEGLRNVTSDDAFTTERDNLLRGRPWAVPDWRYYTATISPAAFLFGIDPIPDSPIDRETGRAARSPDRGGGDQVYISSMARITDAGGGLQLGGPALQALIEQALVPLCRAARRYVIRAAFNEKSRSAFQFVTAHSPAGLLNPTMGPGLYWCAEIEAGQA